MEEESNSSHKDKEGSHHAKHSEHIKIKKSSMWMMISIVLAVLLFISIATKGFIRQEKNSFIFLNSDACTTACEEMEPIAKELAQKAGLSFSKAKYFQPIPIPGCILIKDGILSLSGIQDRASLVHNLCDVTKNDVICGEAEKVQEEAEKEALKSAEQKCTEMEKVEKPKLEVFYVSRCPFGVQAINALYYVAKNFGNKVDIIPRLLVDKAEDGKSTISMHGEEEHKEDLRQICLREEQKDIYWDYIHCYVESGESEKCEATAKVDSKKLEDCTTNRAENYALKDADDWENIYRPKGGSGSPSFFLNGEKINEYEFSANGRSPENIKAIVCCSAKSKLKECDNQLQSAQPPRGFGKIESGSTEGSKQLNCG